MQEAEKILTVVEQFEIDEILFADTEDQKNALWKMRRSVAEAVKGNSIYKEEDTVVPRFELPKLLEGIKRIGNKYGFKSVCYGHAGDGNLHVNIIKGDMTDDNWQTQVPLGIREIFELTVSLKGTLSGEHGIGLFKKLYGYCFFKSSFRINGKYKAFLTQIMYLILVKFSLIIFEDNINSKISYFKFSSDLFFSSKFFSKNYIVLHHQNSIFSIYYRLKHQQWQDKLMFFAH
jgi:hypothetical protein